MRVIALAAASAIALALLALPAPAPAQDADAELIERGERVYRRCVSCHLIDERRNRIGPHLVGIFGRPAGAVEDFNYSNAMEDSGIVWNEETIAAYIRDTRGFIPGNRMAFAGLRNDEDVAAVIAYMREASAE
jgi:cytochrome c